MKEAIQNRERLFALDVLRGIATVLVLFRHLPPNDRVGNSIVEPVIGWLHEIGWVGVDLFFVLSGVLISTLIYREIDETGGFRVKRFLLRRLLKIWPTYFLAFGTAAMLQLIWAHCRGDAVTFNRTLFGTFCSSVFIQNYVRCDSWQHSWTIAVEEHFYTGFAVAVSAFLFFRKSTSPSSTLNSIGLLWAASALFGLYSRYSCCWPWLDWRSACYSTHNRVDSLLFGVFLGCLLWYFPVKSKQMFSSKSLLFVVGLSSLVWPVVWDLKSSCWTVILGFPLIYLCLSAWVGMAALYPGQGRVLLRSQKAFAWVGTYSYTIYIGHSVLFMIPGVESMRQYILPRIDALAGEQVCLWGDRIGFFTISVVFGILLSHVIERPFLRLRSIIAK